MGDRKSRSFQDRLKAFSEVEEEKALKLPPGPERDAALLKIRQAKEASLLDSWANSLESKSPE